MSFSDGCRLASLPWKLVAARISGAARSENWAICFSTELWDLERTAGVPKKGYYNLYPRDAETTRKVFNWVVENVGDHGFREWQAFDHQQLGPVEVGGMVYIWSYRNPPGHLLEEICHNNVMFNLQHAAAAPRRASRSTICMSMRLAPTCTR